MATVVVVAAEVIAVVVVAAAATGTDSVLFLLFKQTELASQGLAVRLI